MVKARALLFVAAAAEAAEYTLYSAKTSYNGHGGIEIDTESSAAAGLTATSCQARCDSDVDCDCVSFRASDGKCWKRAYCRPSLFGSDSKYDTYVKARNLAAFEYKTWSEPIKGGVCSDSITPMNINLTARSGSSESILTCALSNGVKQYRFPSGIFEIDEQLLIPEMVAITGAQNPNDMSTPSKTPDWKEQTLFLATRGAIDYNMNYCHASDMVTTRVGFVLSSHVTVRNLAYQGIDTIRPEDNGGLCGGGAFETKGCAENNCGTSKVNNGGSDGFGSIGVTIENVRINDYHYADDKYKLGAKRDECCSDGTEQCLYCKPNGIRSTQVGIWAPDVRNSEGTHQLFVSNVVSRSQQADGINLHGNIHDSLVQNTHFENTGDDIFVLWGADASPTNVTFKDSTAVNPGITRPGWYGNCVATYGLKSVVFDNIRCKAPTLANPILAPGDHQLRCDTSMFVFFTSFGANYPEGNSIELKDWTFEDLNGTTYTAAMGVANQPKIGKMAWTQTNTSTAIPEAPYYFPSQGQTVNVYVERKQLFV